MNGTSAAGPATATTAPTASDVHLPSSASHSKNAAAASNGSAFGRSSSRQIADNLMTAQVASTASSARATRSSSHERFGSASSGSAYGSGPPLPTTPRARTGKTPPSSA